MSNQDRATIEQAEAGARLPCPFCGGKPQHVYFNTVEDACYRVVCTACDAHGPPGKIMTDEDWGKWNTRSAIDALTRKGGEADDLEIAEAALQRFHDKFMERAHVDPSTGYPEYGSQEDYYTDLCAALDAVKGLQDVPADPREQEYEP